MPDQPAPPSFDELMTTLGALSTRLAGREGNAIREHIQQLAQILEQQGPDAEMRARAAAELEQLVDALAQLGGPRAPSAKATRGMDLTKLAEGLRTFAAYLKAPTDEGQAAVEQLVANLQGVELPKPAPLDELNIDGTVEAIAIESARRLGLSGAELQRAVARMRQQIATLVRQLEVRARQEAARGRAASEMERLLDALIQTGTALARAVALERAAIVQAFRCVDLAHMSEGLRVFGRWLSTPATDLTAHVAALRVQLADALGPATAGDPARSEAERRADFERDIKVAVDQIFRGPGAAPR